MLPDHYRVLSITPSASQEDIRTAYRRMARKHHPDSGGSAEKFQSIQEAYEILGHPSRRREYDARRGGRHRQVSIVEPVTAHNPLRPRGGVPREISPSSEEFDRLFREFDGFFERLEEEFFRTFWGRNE